MVRMPPQCKADRKSVSAVPGCATVAGVARTVLAVLGPANEADGAGRLKAPGRAAVVHVGPGLGQGPRVTKLDQLI